MTGSAWDIDEGLTEWDTVDANGKWFVYRYPSVATDTLFTIAEEPLEWDTVDTDGDDDIRDDEYYDPSVITYRRARLRQQFDIICAVWAAVIEVVSLVIERTEPVAHHASIHLERIQTEAIRDLGRKLDNFRGIFEKTYESGEGSYGSTPAKHIIPIHPISRRARDRFVEVDAATLAPAEFARFLNLLVEDVVVADTYLSIAKDPDHIVACRKAWIQTHLEQLKIT
ncbi:hypothetical protein EV401DRAFT_1361368 [Pisolithus croceorrhizus]|nr:hypothetical protein EV401DRAFT_1361368 [Pisolithus croceorrhizus]